MRKPLAIAAFAAVTLASPVSAQSAAADALDSLDDPIAAEAIAESIEDVTAALLSMPVGPVLNAMRRIDPDMADDIGDDATLGEMTRTDPDLADRLGRETRIAGLVAGQAARDLAVALPVLQAMARDMAAQWENRIADARRNQR